MAKNAKKPFANHPANLVFKIEELPRQTREAFAAAERREEKLAATMVTVAPALNKLFLGGAKGWRITIKQRGRRPWNATIEHVIPDVPQRKGNGAKFVLEPEDYGRMLPDCVDDGFPHLDKPYSTRVSVPGSHDGRVIDDGFAWKSGKASFELRPPK